MSELFLIAHKVSGQPAFDVAIHMDCPLCVEVHGHDSGYERECDECDKLGYWWIIPTSGHRAYPWWHLPLKFEEGRLVMDHNPTKLTWTIFDMPEGLPDHYAHSASPTRPKLDITALLKPTPVRIHRRF